MGTVHYLDKRDQKDTPESRAWEDYRLARLKAEESLDLGDGIAAGRAWARFINIFLAEKQ